MSYIKKAFIFKILFMFKSDFTQALKTLLEATGIPAKIQGANAS